MKLTTSNVVTGNISVSQLTIGNTAIVESLNLGNVNFTPSAVTVGNVSITPSGIITPSLIVGGASYSGGTWGGIINYQEFTASGTWNNPYANASANASLTGNEQVLVMAWGGGGGGSTNNRGGGGGGACVIGNYALSQLGSTVSVTVGVGGGSGLNGGNTSFDNLIAYGGGSGNDDDGGGGGGWLGVGGSSVGAVNGGAPLGGANAVNDGLPGGTSTFGGGGGVTWSTNAATGTAGGSIFGGGGAGNILGRGGNSIFGAAGGAGATRGISVFGGSGANNSTAATTPGGGGSGNATYITGARGEVRVWVMGTGGTTLGAPTYILTANTTTLNEGSSVLYTVTTTNISNGTSLYYAINTTASSATSADFTTAVNGAVIINGGTGTFILTANNDTDSANEAFQIDIRTNSTTGSIVASNGSVTIVPTIQAVYNGYTFIGDDNLTTSTWSSAPISTADTNRRVIVVIYQRQSDDALNNTTASAVTIGGVSATVLEYRGDDTRGHVDIWGATVPTGTTADVAVTWRYPTGDAKTLAAYSLYGANLTPYSTANNRVAATTVSANVNVVAGGFVIAAAGADSPGGSFSTFTAGVDTNSPISTIGSSGSPGWGSKSITSTQTNYTVTANSTAGGDLLLAVTSFQPG